MDASLLPAVHAGSEQLGPTGCALRAFPQSHARCKHLRASSFHRTRDYARLCRAIAVSDPAGARTKKHTPGGAGVFFLAGPTGFEPAISSVTGRRDRPTSLRALVGAYA